jgi:hypothetical protein
MAAEQLKLRSIGAINKNIIPQKPALLYSLDQGEAETLQAARAFMH